MVMFLVRTITARGQDVAAAKAAYVAELDRIAATQDLSEDLRPQTRNLTIFFTAFAAVFVALRFVARWRRRAAVLADDWLMLVSMVLLIGNMAMNLELIKLGLGLHSGMLNVDQLGDLSRTVLGAEILYVTAVNMYKLSLLYLYFRIFPVQSVRKGGYILGGLSTAWNIACIVAATFQCTPQKKLWEPWLEGTCINLFLAQLCIAVPSILCDIGILCLPIPHVWRLQTNLTQRIFLMGIFLLGSYVVFASIYRFKIFLGYRPDDIPWTLADGCAWNIIEISSGIVSACIPTLGPLVKTIFTSLYPSSRGTSNGLGSSMNKRSNNLVTIGGSGANTNSSRNRWNRLGGSAEDSKYGIDTNDRDFLNRSNRGQVTVQVSHTGGSNDNLANDEIPLTAIRMQQEVEMTIEERKESEELTYPKEVRSRRR